MSNIQKYLTLGYKKVNMKFDLNKTSEKSLIEEDGQ